MLPTIGSRITQAIWSPSRANACFEPLRIIEFERERVGRPAGRHSRRRRRAVRQRAASRFHQQAVDVAVVAAGELHDAVAAR